MLKHMPEKSLEKYEESYIVKNRLKSDRDRRHNWNTDAGRTDPNITDRLSKFADIIKTDTVYRISLIFLVGLGLVNFLIEFNTKFIFTLKNNLSKLFVKNAKKALIPNETDAKTIFHEAPYLQYEQFKLTENFRKYLVSTLISKHALRTGINLVLIKNHVK